MSLDRGLSIIVCNYNSSLESVFLTLSSSLLQKDIPYEIIFCDDASKDNHKKEIVSFFKKHDFRDYKLCLSPNNSGTVINILNGLHEAKYRYCKYIGSGDLFYDSRSLKDAVDFFEKYDCDFITAKCCYFYDVDGDIKTFNMANPVDYRPYEPNRYKPNKIKKRLLLDGDFCLGASIYAKTEVALNMLEHFRNKIIYSEDSALIYECFKGSKIMYLNSYNVLYEYGSGISTNQNNSFLEKIRKDNLVAFNEIGELSLDKKARKIYKKYQKLCNAGKLKKLICNPSMYLLRNKRKHIKKDKPNLEFLKLCKEMSKHEL